MTGAGLIDQDISSVFPTAKRRSAWVQPRVNILCVDAGPVLPFIHATGEAVVLQHPDTCDCLSAGRQGLDVFLADDVWAVDQPLLNSHRYSPMYICASKPLCPVGSGSSAQRAIIAYIFNKINAGMSDGG